MQHFVRWESRGKTRAIRYRRSLDQETLDQSSEPLRGGETEVCVLATVMSAVDLGYRVVLATDALCSVSDQTHDALMLTYGQRFSQQIETATTEQILQAWN